MAADQVFYVGQKAIIQRDGKVLVLERNPFGADLPGGKIQEGELDFTVSLEREVEEETGLEITVGKPIATGYYEFPDSIKAERPLKSDYIYLVFYEVHDVIGTLRLSDEHQSYQWIGEEDIDTIKEDNGVIKEVLLAYFHR